MVPSQINVMQVVVYFIYFTLLIVFLIYAGIAILHATKFCYLSRASKKMTVIFLSLSGILVIGSLILILTINWEKL